MEKSKVKVLVNNTIMMYLLTIAKLVVPLISLPYLTRVLSVDCYGTVSFVKSLISYMQVLVDFGFLLSGTKDIVDIIKNNGNPKQAIGNTLYAQLILSLISAVLMLICSFSFNIIDGYVIFSMLSVVPVVLSVFLFEYVFKAYEKMDKIAIKFIVMKVIALILTMIFVKSDNDVYLMPIFDILGSLTVVFMTFVQLKKMNIQVDFKFSKIKQAFISLKNSFVYFMSNFATTAFTLLNTLIIGIILTKADVAYWNVTMQLVTAVQAMYAPIINSVFPTMLKEKNLKIIHKIMLIYMPLIFAGCGIILVLGDWAVNLVFGSDYLMSSTLLKWLIPTLIFAFPGMLYGWPCLTAINKPKIATYTTIVSAVVQVLGLLLLSLISQFNLIGICIIRNITEICLCIPRVIIIYKNKSKFDNSPATTDYTNPVIEA